MCGISGIWAPTAHKDIREDVLRMTDAIRYRGPDAGGIWSDDACGLILGHRRLSILELSEAGAQPMVSSSGRYVMVFNGEIYNHLDIRKTLKGRNPAIGWRGHSDTETLLASIEICGLEKTLADVAGMFAIALWDRQERTLSLIRDRVGEKPLYYGIHQGRLLFASELKSFKALPWFKPEIDRQSLAQYFRFNAVPDPYCIYQGIHKLLPGGHITICLNDILHNKLPEPVRYWSLPEVCQESLEKPFMGSEQQAVDEFERLFQNAVSEQSIADVPLGAFLSGGVDSSAVVAMMQSLSSRRVSTFTIGFTEQSFNEAPYAKAVAAHLGTDHHELYVTPEQALAVVPKLPEIYCEPFADSSQIPTYLVSKLAKQHVTVSLSGDAGDELFGGYSRYMVANSALQRTFSMPAPLRRLGGAALGTLDVPQWDAVIKMIGSVLPSKVRSILTGKRMHRLADLLSHADFDSYYRTVVTHWQGNDLVSDAELGHSFYDGIDGLPQNLTPSARLMALDILGYLPTDILVKVDRAAMANSLETRTPLLDHRIVEFAQRLPLHMKIRNGQTKWILRQSLYRKVPRNLIERPKMGFGVPISSWLRGPLREWAESLLVAGDLENAGLQSAIIRQRWGQHVSGAQDWEHHLWDVLQYMAWLNSQHSSTAAKSIVANS